MTGCSPKPRPLDLGTSRAHGTLDWHLPRCLALLGGTTGWPDCVEALRHLLTPTQLVQGAKVDAYERAFARTVGVKHAISFASGRVGLYGLLQVLGVGEGAEVLLSVPTHVVVAMQYVTRAHDPSMSTAACRTTTSTSRAQSLASLRVLASFSCSTRLASLWS